MHNDMKKNIYILLNIVNTDNKYSKLNNRCIAKGEKWVFLTNSIFLNG